MRFKGGILYYSLLIMILSASIIALILLSSFFDNRLLSNSMKQDELERNVYSAINIFTSGEDIFKEADSVSLNMFDDNSEDVDLIKKKWGNYYVVSAYSGWKNMSYFKEALIGSDPFSGEHVALFMKDEGRILSISGNTILRGTCYLPGNTLRPSSIEGQSYINKKLVFGGIKKSPLSLPEINKSLFDFALKYLSEGPTINDSVININALGTNKIENSFKNKTILINNENVRSLSDYSFFGNIILWSSHPIIIEDSAKLEDVILFAPKILFKSGFKGTLQAFAVQSIVVERNCEFGFPSQLCVIQSESKYNPADSLSISIGKESTLDGAAFIKSSGLTSFIKIDKKAIIRGQVYCPGIVELQGSIFGSLYCKTFYLETSKARYYNHLLNVSIDFNSLPKHFVAVELLKEIPKKSVIKWLE